MMGDNSFDIQYFCCAKCSSILSQPISICPSGHNICGACRKNNNFCSSCGFPYALQCRNEILENLMKALITNCPHYMCNQQMLMIDFTSHLMTCQYSTHFRCTEGCGLIQEKLATHLIRNHKYLDFDMGQLGGVRCFTAPLVSWESPLNFPPCVFHIGSEDYIVKAWMSKDVFHILLFRTSDSRKRVCIKIKSVNSELAFKGIPPHINEDLSEKSKPHFICDSNIITECFLTKEENNGKLEVTITLLKS